MSNAGPTSQGGSADGHSIDNSATTAIWNHRMLHVVNKGKGSAQRCDIKSPFHQSGASVASSSNHAAAAVAPPVPKPILSTPGFEFAIPIANVTSLNPPPSSEANGTDAYSTREQKLREKRRLLAEWMLCMSALSKMHKLAYERCHRLSVVFMVPMIALSTISSVTNFILAFPSIFGDSNIVEDAGNSKDCDAASKPTTTHRSVAAYASLALGAVSMVNTSITALYGHLNLGARKDKHLTVSSDFEKLSRQIRVHSLLTETDERMYVNLSEYIKDVHDQYEQLVDHMPYIPRHIVERYETQERVRTPNRTSMEVVEGLMGQSDVRWCEQPSSGKTFRRMNFMKFGCRRSNVEV